MRNLAGRDDVTDVPTKADVDLKANDADVVHDTGDETVAGAKTFSGSVATEKLAVGRAVSASYQAVIQVDIGDNVLGLRVDQNDTTNNPDAAKIVNTGTGYGLKVDQVGGGQAANFAHTTGGALTLVGMTGLNTAQSTLKVENLAVQTTGAILGIVGDQATRTAPCIQVDNAGTSSDTYSARDGVGGTQVWAVHQAGYTRGPAGSNSLPAFSFLADPNTGIYNPAADTVGVALGGTERCRFTGDNMTIKGSIQNYSSVNNGRVQVVAAGVTIDRNIADANPVLVVNAINAGAAGPIMKIVSAATNDDPTEEIWQARAATTDATVTTLHTTTLAASQTVLIEAVVVARRTGGSGSAEDGAGYSLRGTYKNAAGTATLIGALSADYTAESVAGYDATLAVSGATVLLRITGVAATNITWHATIRIYRVGS